MLCFRIFPVAKKIMSIRGGGLSRFYVEFFLSRSAENFRRGMIYCCNKFGYRKGLDKRGEYQGFPSKVFLSQSAEKFSRGTLLRCVSETFR